VIVEVRCAKVGLSCGARPYRVDAVLGAPIQRAEAVALVEGYEERGMSILESLTVEDAWHQAREVVITRADGCGANASRPAHVITVVGGKPHEVGRRTRIQIVNQNAVRHTTATTRIR
jgi:hypothetical protein